MRREARKRGPGPSHVLMTPDHAGNVVAPGIVVRSGTHGHRHLCWPLSEPLSISEAERANRRLSQYLGADLGSVCNAAALLRPPFTNSFKHHPPVPVTLEHLDTQRRRADDILAGLPQLSPEDAPTVRQSVRPTAVLDPQLTIDPVRYAQVLAGLVAGRDRRSAARFTIAPRPCTCIGLARVVGNVSAAAAVATSTTSPPGCG
jgi:hypothetical protein